MNMSYSCCINCMIIYLMSGKIRGETDLKGLKLDQHWWSRSHIKLLQIQSSFTAVLCWSYGNLVTFGVKALILLVVGQPH